MLSVFDGNNVMYRLASHALNPIMDFVTKVQQEETPVVVWDGAYAKQYRQRICPEYKAKHKPSGDNIYAYMDLVKKALNHVKCVQVCIKEHEGDDLINALCQYYDVKWIDSTDRDLLRIGPPLLPYPNETVDREFELVKKTLVGDKSDNIPGVRGFGPKSWDRLSVKERLDIKRVLEGNYPSLTEFVVLHTIWEQRKKLQSYYRVMSFRQISHDLLAKCSTFGVDNPLELHKIISRTMI